jgi:hypothetical protein
MLNLLCYDPKRRIAAEEAGKHGYFLCGNLAVRIGRAQVPCTAKVPYRNIRICSLPSLVRLPVRGKSMSNFCKTLD